MDPSGPMNVYVYSLNVPQTEPPTVRVSLPFSRPALPGVMDLGLLKISFPVGTEEGVPHSIPWYPALLSHEPTCSTVFLLQLVDLCRPFLLLFVPLARFSFECAFVFLTPSLYTEPLQSAPSGQLQYMGCISVLLCET